MWPVWNIFWRYSRVWDLVGLVDLVDLVGLVNLVDLVDLVDRFPRQETNVGEWVEDTEYGPGCSSIFHTS